MGGGREGEGVGVGRENIGGGGKEGTHSLADCKSTCLCQTSIAQEQARIVHGTNFQHFCHCSMSGASQMSLVLRLEVVFLSQTALGPHVLQSFPNVER